MASTAERIKERLGIVEVISSYIKVDSAGANFKARCPFHNEKTPSFFISPARNNYYCFGCGVKGDIFSFVQEYEKLDFLGALKVLAERAGIELQEFKSEAYKESERDYKILELASDFFEAQLAKKTDALKYLHDRGLTDQSIKDWNIGYAPDEWRSVSEFLVRNHGAFMPHGLEDMEAVGLVKLGEGGKCYDRFRSRIMFPLFDSSGRTVGFSGRIFGKDDSGKEGEGGPKYLNSPDSHVFNKSEVLYGFDRAKHAIREWGYAILVEGQMDLLMSHQAGIKNAIATSGTALTASHLEKIGRMTKNLVFMYDADNAGYGATRRGERLAIEQGFDVKVVTLPKGEDPASLIQKDKKAFIDALKKSTHVVEYYLGVLVEKYPKEHDLIKAIEKDIVPDIALTPSAIRRGELISLVSARGLKSKIHEKHITEEVDRIVKQIEAGGREAVLGSSSGSFGANKKAASFIGDEKITLSHMYANEQSYAAKAPVDLSLRRMVALLVYMEELIAKGEPVVSALVVGIGQNKSEKKPALSIESLATILKTAEEQCATFIQGQEAELVADLRKNNRDELLFEAEAFFDQSEKLDRQLFEFLFELEERSLKQKLSRYMADLTLAEGAKDRVKSDEIIKKCQEISTRLSELHRKKIKT